MWGAAVYKIASCCTILITRRKIHSHDTWKAKNVSLTGVNLIIATAF